ncbi:MAG: hypothetical protein EHJ95_08405 [Methanobacteriota archaeon]|nr:MAG: hypothetical protein EHJ95_08405 [Euryarchaeota archaeon]
MLSSRDLFKISAAGMAALYVSMCTEALPRLFARIPGGTPALLSVPRQEFLMFILLIAICLLLFLAVAGADLLLSNINSDELSNMGVEKKV